MSQMETRYYLFGLLLAWAQAGQSGHTEDTKGRKDKSLVSGSWDFLVAHQHLFGTTNIKCE
jgi:hypothetical protein